MRHCHKKYLLGIILGIALALVCILLVGCHTTDPSVYIQKNCPYKRVYGERLDEVVRDGLFYDGKTVWLVGNCWRDAVAISRWAESKGIECDVLPAPARVGNRIITGGHMFVQPIGSRYYVEYRDGVGIVRIRIGGAE